MDTQDFAFLWVPKNKRGCAFAVHSLKQFIYWKLSRALLRLPCAPFRLRWIGRVRSSDPGSYWRHRKRGGNRGIRQDDARSRFRPKGTAFALSTSKLSGLYPYSSLFPISGHRPGQFHERYHRCTCPTKELYESTVLCNSNVISGLLGI